MKIIDAYLLARTKRKTRRIRTALVTLVSSLLFAVLFFAAFVAAGVVDSANQVKDVGFNSRYMVSLMNTGGSAFDYTSAVNKIYTDMDAELRARGVKVTADTKLDASYVAEHTRRLTNTLNANQLSLIDAFEAGVSKLGTPSALYHMTPMNQSEFLTYHDNPSVDPKVEALKKVGQDNANPNPAGYDPLSQLEFFSIEKDMLRTQLGAGQTFDWQPGQPVPLVVPYPYLEKLAGKSFAGVDAAVKNQGYKDLITAYTGKLLDYCWRNNTANMQLQSVITYNKQAVEDKDKTTNPINIPNCGDFDQAQLKKLKIIVEPTGSDVKPLFVSPTPPPPQVVKLQFKLVGFVPGISQFGDGNILTTIFSSVGQMPIASNPGMVPAEVVAVHPQLKQKSDFVSAPLLFADFTNRADQKAFLAKGCQGDECQKGIKPYMLPYGNLNVALEGVFEFVSKFILGAALVMMVIASLMILFTISKVIADSTKEIAVFRALGARRRDIAHIYYTYGAMLTASALLFAIIIAVGTAYTLSIGYGDSFKAGLVQAVGAYTLDPHVSLLGIQPVWLAGVTAALVVSAFVGISIPVGAALRRKLINILREE